MAGGRLHMGITEQNKLDKMIQVQFRTELFS